MIKIGVNKLNFYGMVFFKMIKKDCFTCVRKTANQTPP